MDRLVAAVSAISTGTTSRLIKKSWVNQGSVQAVAFDLRDRTPPELYVSFSMTSGKTDDEHLHCACCDLSAKLKGGLKGFIALLDVAVCLEEINDEESDIICFRDEILPHCGLYYLTKDLQKIQEVKTAISYLASERLYEIPNEYTIKTQISGS